MSALRFFFEPFVLVVYFWIEFNVYFGIIVLVTLVLYLAATVVITEWRTKFRYNYLFNC